MSVFDVIVIVLLIISAIFGFRKGLIMQLFGLLAIFLGVYCAFKFSGLISSLIGKWTEVDPVVLSVVAFIIIMILVWVAVVLLGKLLDTMIKVAALGLLNRFFGVVFAVVKTVFIIGVIVYALSFLNITKNEEINKDLEKSQIYKPMRRLTEAAFPYINFYKFDKNDTK